tara:strand:+ start:7100 stop:7666 length:567 start_codon:yes stop_codon:yes gene_type:complete
MDLSFDNQTSRSARLRRELRNPSMITVTLIVVGVIGIISAPFAPGWISTAQASFESLSKQDEMREASINSASVVIPSQITPWLAVQTRKMINAEGPLDWHAVSFRRGACAEENLVQLPEGKYANAIATACDDLNDIQQRYSGDCFLAASCNVSDVAKQEITATMNLVWDAFSDAGFVLPYEVIEEGLP